MSRSFQSIQDDIQDFLETANGLLPDQERLYFGGTYLTGALETPDFLFLGINPGYGDCWQDRPRAGTRKPFEKSTCKYVEERKDGGRLALRVTGVLLGGQHDKLAACAETSLRSFFATPDVSTLNRQLSALSAINLKDRHDRLMREAIESIISALRPKNIVCLGLTTFQDYVKAFGNGSEEISMKWVDSKSGKTQPVYYKRTTINAIPIHGLIHLSGGRPSATMIDGLKDIFSKLEL